MINKKFFLAALLITAVTLPAYAQDPRTDEPSAAAMAADVLLVRPLAFGATILGTAIFLVGLPVIAASQSTQQAAEKLIEDPMKYTFQRPLGQSSY